MRGDVPPVDGTDPTGANEFEAEHSGVPLAVGGRHCLRAGDVPAPSAVAISLPTSLGHRQRVLQLDETASRMKQRCLDRDDHTHFEGPIGMIGGVGNGAPICEPRRFVADDAHPVGNEVQALAVR